MDSKINEFIDQLSSFQVQLDQKKTFLELKTEFCIILGNLLSVLERLDEIDHTKLPDSEKYHIERLKYTWSLYALDFSILLRDGFLAFSKTEIKNIINSLQFDYQDLKRNIIDIPSGTRDVFNTAITELKDFLGKPKGATQEPVENLEQWFHQSSPVPTVISQIIELQSQIEQIFSVQDKLCPVIPKFNRYREHLIDHNNSRIIQLRLLEEELDKSLKLINSTETELNKSDLSQLSKTIDKISQQVENHKNNQHQHDAFDSQSGEIVVPIYADGGELYTRLINLDKNVELWSDTEILPKMLDADFDISNLYDNALITLFNARNKIENLGFSQEESYIFDKEVFSKALQKSRAEIVAYKDNLDSTITELNTYTMNELQLENIYNKDREFLPELGFINLTKYTGQRIWYETNIWSDWKMRVNQFFHNRKIPFISNLNADPYSFIQSKQLSEQDLDNNSLFLKKGYLGKSFYLHRMVEEQKIQNAFSLWKDGYQGSVLLSGTYGSGKSTLIENISNLLPGAQILYLKQNNSIQLKGRKHFITGKLNETITFIEKQSISNHVVACIDDLERWQSEDYSMYNAVNDLLEGIAKYGKRIFFIVSTNHFMLAHIQRMFDFKSRFSETIVIDKMYQKSIANALVIRHNASLKDYSEEANRNIGKKAAKIARKNRYNIGASMTSWERQNDKDSTEIIMPPPSFYEIINTHQLILKVILANKLMKESVLRQGLTPLDNNFVSEELRKLRGYKIIKRTFDGFLQVDPVIVHDVEACLKK